MTEVKMVEVVGKGFECTRCKHVWIPNNPNKPPKVCPSCNSPYWMKERRKPKEVKSNEYQ